MKITTTSDITVDLIKQAGDDSLIIASAKVSTRGADSLRFVDEDPAGSQGLIEWLMKHKHGTPFEAGWMMFFVDGPIFMFREWHRHRIWSYNETSGRYRQLEPRFYVPNPHRPLKQVGKPGAYQMVPGDPGLVDYVADALPRSYQAAYDEYLMMLDAGVSKEVARAVLPVGIMTTMYASCNPRSLMHFLGLRTDDTRATFPSKPMLEIEAAARQMEVVFAEHWPITYEAWNKFGRVCP